MKENVADLRFDELVGMDRDSLEALYCHLGTVGAEAIVCRAMEELASRLTELRVLYDHGSYAELSRRARGLIGIAEQVGLTSLARVAGDVTQCANTSDLPGLAATLSRLERVGDRSVTAVWDLRDLSV